MTDDPHTPSATDRTPQRVTNATRGQVKPSERTIRALEAIIDNDPRWRDD